MAHKKASLSPDSPRRRPGPPKKFNLALQQKFCELFQAGGTVEQAAKKCGVTGVTVYQTARTDPTFKDMYQAALELNTDDLESLLHRMARAGNVAALFGTLKARRPERWRENFKMEHFGSLMITSADQLEQAQSRAKLRDQLPAPEARH